MLEHPNHVLAISTVRLDEDRTRMRRGEPIVSIGTLSVERVTDEETRFAATHVLFDTEDDWRAPGAHIRCLLHPHSYALGCSARIRTRNDRLRVSGSASYEELPGTAHLPPLQRHVIWAGEETLADLGRENGLQVSQQPRDLLQAKREAADRAQVTWLMALGFVRNAEERRQLYAAWQAWSALQLAAVPF